MYVPVGVAHGRIEVSEQWLLFFINELCSWDLGPAGSSYNYVVNEILARSMKDVTTSGGCEREVGRRRWGM